MTLLKPKAGDALILPDGDTRARIEEVSEGMVSISRSVAPIPILHLAPATGERNVWRLLAASSSPQLGFCAGYELTAALKAAGSG